MRIIRIIPIITLLGLTCIAKAQIDFQPGFLVRVSGEKIACTIYNIEPKNTPQHFEYKLPGSDVVLIADTSNTLRVVVTGRNTWVCAETDVDLSSDVLTELSNQRSPEWSHQKLFLQQLVEGNASLYKYVNNNSKRLFYSVHGSKITQLICKQYNYQDKSQFSAARYVVNYNNDFQQQLWQEVRLPDVKISDIESMIYDSKELTRYFLKYNGQPAVSDSQAKEKKFELKLKAGIEIGKVSITDHYYLSHEIAGNTTSVRLGAELVYYFPIFRNKLLFVAEPVFINKVAGLNEIYYSTIELNTGLRYKMFFNNHTNFFIHGIVGMGTGLNFNSRVELKPVFTSEKQYLLNNPVCFAAGAGFEWRSLSIEATAFTKKDFIHKYLSGTVIYKHFAIVLGYKLSKF